jgi:OST3 / OST6 family, transporter family
MQSEMHLSGDETKRPIIFAKIEYNALNSDVFAISNYTSVPILALAQPSLVKSFRQTHSVIYPAKLEWKISSMDFFDAGKIIEHINKITNSNVELKYTLGRVMLGNAIILGACLVLFVLKNYIAMIIQNKTAWMVGTFIIFVM